MEVAARERQTQRVLHAKHELSVVRESRLRVLPGRQLRPRRHALGWTRPGPHEHLAEHAFPHDHERRHER